jgi:Spy/CpxP family protein refolding chaperone
MLTDTAKRLIAHYVLAADQRIRAGSSRQGVYERVFLANTSAPLLPVLATVPTLAEAEQMIREANAYIDSLSYTPEQREKMQDINREYHKALDRAEVEYRTRLNDLIDSFLAEQMKAMGKSRAEEGMDG